ncbi:MAG: hypothetical protein IJ664_02680 [Clostridia bacterium]|nr:hypothetical protein [Clostridia bacterium]
MNYFVEGLQGSGKSTLVQKLSELNPGYTAIREGEYSPVELSWCAYVDADQYDRIVEKYPGLRPQIEEKTFVEGDKKVICYTKIVTENRAFYQELEQHEIYNNRIPFDTFQSIVLGRYQKWNSDRMIFECSLFQNIVEDMTLFRQAEDEEILSFYRQIRKALDGKEYRIVYLKAKDIRGNLEVIRKERSDEQGNEVWFPMMMGFFNDCPYAKTHKLKGEEDLIRHFIHRQEMELRICKEIFPDKSVIIESKNYSEKDITFCG